MLKYFFAVCLLSLLALSSCTTKEKAPVSEVEIDEPANNPVFFESGIQAEETSGCHTEFGFVPEGATIMAYTEAQVQLPQTCQAVTRVCIGGALSGIGSFLSCFENPTVE